MAKLNTFILSTGLSAPTTKKYKYSYGNNGNENAPQGNVAHTLSYLAPLTSVTKNNRRKCGM
jgi:hypothetical protein